jgi:hypothetical protein
MKKRRGIMAILLVVALLVSVVGTATVAQADEVSDAIDAGLAWLARVQDPATGAWSLGYYPVACTAQAVNKFCEHAKKTRDPVIDPFDPAYEYSENIVKGLEYLFRNAGFEEIGIQPAGDPDMNIDDDLGIYFMSPSGRSGYETGIVMMALESTCHPDMVVEDPDSPVNGWAFLDIMKNCVDWVAWAQNEVGNGRGGWRYGPNYSSSDNSVSQWPALGLMSAMAWDVHAPDWVKAELRDYWLDYSQHDVTGQFGYTGTTGGTPIAMTASGLIQLTYCGVPQGDPRWQAGRDFIGNNWGAIGDLYAMYAVMKAAMTTTPAIVLFGEVDWQAEYDPWIIANQHPDGYWPGGGWGNEVLNTCWALFILQKVAPPPPPPPVKVPGISGWGILAAVLVVAGVMVVMVRRRRFAKTW